MERTQRYLGVNKDMTYGTVGMFANDQDFLITDPDAEPLGDEYYFLYNFTPAFDLRYEEWGWIKLGFQKGNQASNWEYLKFEFKDTLAPDASALNWAQNGGKETDLTYTKGEENDYTFNDV